MEIEGIQSAGRGSYAEQLKATLTLRKALFGNRLLVNTEVAAEALGRSPKTLRKWSMLGRGPIHPVRVDGGLLWRVDDLMRLSEGGAR